MVLFNELIVISINVRFTVYMKCLEKTRSDRDDKRDRNKDTQVIKLLLLKVIHLIIYWTRRMSVTGKHSMQDLKNSVSSVEAGMGMEGQIICVE